MKFSERLQRLPGYPLAELPARKRALLAQGVDVIDLGAGDADYPPPAEVIEAMREAVGVTALSKYGFQQGNPAFREAACRWMARRFGARFDPVTETLPLLGSKEGLSHLPLAVLDRGDVAVVPEPGYQAYLGGTVLAGGEPYVYPLTPRTDYLVELAELPAEVLARVRLVFLNYPNNPTAAIAPRGRSSRDLRRRDFPPRNLRRGPGRESEGADEQWLIRNSDRYRRTRRFIDHRSQ